MTNFWVSLFCCHAHVRAALREAAPCRSSAPTRSRFATRSCCRWQPGGFIISTGRRTKIRGAAIRARASTRIAAATSASSLGGSLSCFPPAGRFLGQPPVSGRLRCTPGADVFICLRRFCVSRNAARYPDPRRGSPTRTVSSTQPRPGHTRAGAALHRRHELFVARRWRAVDDFQPRLAAKSPSAATLPCPCARILKAATGPAIDLIPVNAAAWVRTPPWQKERDEKGTLPEMLLSPTARGRFASATADSPCCSRAGMKPTTGDRPRALPSRASFAGPWTCDDAAFFPDNGGHRDDLHRLRRRFLPNAAPAQRPATGTPEDFPRLEEARLQPDPARAAARSVIRLLSWRGRAGRAASAACRVPPTPSPRSPRPRGRLALALVRVSGPDTAEIARGILGETPPPRHARHGDYRAQDGRLPGTTRVATFFPEVNSYTGEDALELLSHGTPFIAQTILEDLFARGCRPAGPGEFTQRAFLSGPDGSQPGGGGVMDLIHARSERATASANQQLRGRNSAGASTI